MPARLPISSGRRKMLYTCYFPCQKLHKRAHRLCFCSHRVTSSENGITNGIEIFRTSGGATRVMASNNDCMLRSLDPEALKITTCAALPAKWSLGC